MCTIVALQIHYDADTDDAVKFYTSLYVVEENFSRRSLDPRTVFGSRLMRQLDDSFAAGNVALAGERYCNCRRAPKLLPPTVYRS